MNRQYWNAFFTPDTWEEFLLHGANAAGFNETKFSAAKKIAAGDRLLCYVSKHQRWVAVLEATSTAYWSTEPIWTSGLFPARVRVEPRHLLAPDHGLAVQQVAPRLKEFQALSNPKNWGSVVRRSPKLWADEDGWAIEDELLAVP